MNSELHVLIIGAGLGGLTLAQGLRKQGISFQIFERDASAEARGQGYAVGLHDPEKLFGGSLPDEVFSSVRSSCHLLPLQLPSCLAMFFPDGRAGYVTDSPETPCLRAHRLRLRQALARDLDIQWGKRAQRIEEGEDKVTVWFEDGTHAEGTILVGADGTFSAVRPHVLQKPNSEVLEVSTSSTLTMGECRLDRANMESQLQLAYSCYVAYGPDFILFSGLNRVSDDGSYGDYYWMMVESREVGDDHWVKTGTAEERLRKSKERIQALNPKFRVTVEKTEVEGLKKVVAWYDALIEDIPPVNRVILIGDAAHPMTPARGEGANHAIKDAVGLSKLLAENKDQPIDILRQKLDELQRSLVSEGNQAILLARQVMAKARQRERVEKPMVWGHEVKIVDEAVPLPLELK
ncbi:FAD/NAD(P)-binding domain-containing protein [Neurospora crassa]|uniref:Early conidial development-2 protein n=1 Tax=Neurospora crassa (strain ATCC 24698 / 74-OR23-1A / CBS 708.71 / DSM 1257 / FGSC 987) TaxID=367110 RepID=A7UX65_NEUCR|nr:early conidial development-2 protein [Neurospora crassa OR74A]EDO64978.2 early conidial development-2 protein [Neurospora crassa OR74A]KHE80448.1 FAD/NAD(P)-binding domain-containing protein [Neurospora crassa]|eukprot:XP_001728069.2 early conidial development-2 protein [Neurospora crassa OR74A]